MPNRVLWFLSSLLSKYDAQTGKFVLQTRLFIFASSPSFSEPAKKPSKYRSQP